MPLELAAVAGQRVESQVLSLGVRNGPDEVGAGLDELVDSGFLVSVGGHLLTYQFIHALVRDTVEEVMSPSVQAGLHLRIAEALEQIYEPTSAPCMPNLRDISAPRPRSAGWSAAFGTGDSAAEQAKSAGAYDEAISHLEAVLQMLPDESVETTEVHGRARPDADAQGSRVQGAGHVRARVRSGPPQRLGAAGGAGRLGYEEAVHQPGAPGGPAVRMVSEAIRLIGEEQGPLPRAPAGLAQPQSVPGRRPGATRSRPVIWRCRWPVPSTTRMSLDRRASSRRRSCQREPPPMLEASTELRDVAMRIGDSWSGVVRHRQHRSACSSSSAESTRPREVLEAARTLVSERGRFLLFQFMATCTTRCWRWLPGRFDDAEQAAERAHAVGVLQRHRCSTPACTGCRCSRFVASRVGSPRCCR